LKNLLLVIVIILIIQTTASSQSCLPEGIIFTSQAEIDNFQANYPNCTEIEGTVEISGNDISNLNGLNVLTSIGATLVITNNESLTNLTGLDNLMIIGGYLRIFGNESLNSLSALSNLTSMGGSLVIEFNDALTSLSGLNNIDAESIINLQITHNSSLSNCEAQSICEYLSSPNGYVRIAYNASGCNNPPEIANGCGITLPCLPYGEYIFYTQTQIDSFQTNYPNCIELAGYVRIRGNISNLNGLSIVNTINGNLCIEYNHNLTNLSGLNSLTYIEESLFVWENHSMTDLTGIFGLDSVGGAIWIKDNYALTNLSGLDSMTSIGGNLTIQGNSFLIDLYGINSVDYASISNLIIVDNLLLSSCEAISICNYLANPNGGITISNNATGCNNQAEVEEACTVFTPEILLNSEFLIFPNPVKKELFILNKNGIVINEVNIYNQLGQKVIHENQQTEMINVSMLEQGMYIIELVSDNLKIRDKLIIKQ
jgi:hypothetical protein